jgi:hypothetical protein
VDSVPLGRRTIWGELTPEGDRLRKRMIADVPPAPTALTLQPVENGDRFRR